MKRCIAARPPATRAYLCRRCIAPCACSRARGYSERHDFGDRRARYEEAGHGHHDHLINVRTGEVIEFRNEQIEQLQERVARELGFRLIGHRLELFGVPVKNGKG